MCVCMCPVRSSKQTDGSYVCLHVPGPCVCVVLIVARLAYPLNIHLQQILAGVIEIALLLKERAKTLSQHFLRVLGNAVAHELHATLSLFDWAYKVCEREHSMFNAGIHPILPGVIPILGAGIQGIGLC